MSRVLRPRGTKVIKNNDGVAVVEGTPAASLVKDVDRFFATKPPEIMAGESISQPRKIDPNNRNLKSITKKAPEADNTMFIGGSKDFNEKTGRVEPGFRDKPSQSERRDKETLKEYAARMERPSPKKDEREDQPRISRDSKPRRNEAKDRATARRERFFERRRSRKEAKRSEREQEATQGKFITTLGR